MKTVDPGLSRRDRQLLTDFGISLVVGSYASQTDSIGFTAGYVAPQVVTGDEVGPPADVYGLGASLFRSASGKAAFGGGGADGNLLAIAARAANEPVPDLRVKGIPDEFYVLIEGAMAKSPGDRPTADGLAGPRRCDAGPERCRRSAVSVRTRSRSTADPRRVIRATYRE